jgi:hypothetical protein
LTTFSIIATVPAMRHVAMGSALLALAGCGHLPPPSRIPTADDAIARMRATFACANGIQGEAKIDHFSPQGRVRGQVLLIAVNPDRVRFDVVPPFGVTLYTLTSNGENFALYDLKEKEFLFGPATPCNLARLTQVPVPGHALVSLLRGEAPVLVHSRTDESLAWDASGGFYRVVLKSTRDAGEEVHLEVRPEDWSKPWSEQRMRVTDVRVFQRGVDLYHAELDHHAPTTTAEPRVDPDGVEPPIPPSGGTCDAEIPRSIRMRVPNTDEDVIFQYKDVRWNPPIAPGAFTQPIPSGVRTRFVNCEKN